MNVTVKDNRTLIFIFKVLVTAIVISISISASAANTGEMNYYPQITQAEEDALLEELLIEESEVIENKITMIKIYDHQDVLKYTVEMDESDEILSPELTQWLNKSDFLFNSENTSFYILGD